MSVCFASQVALEGLRPTIPPGISPHICKLMKICMNEDPAKRPKFDMIVPILEKMQDKWKSSSTLLLCWTGYLAPNGGVVLTSIALNSHSAAAFNAPVASASETNPAAVTSFILLCFSFFSMWYQVFICVFMRHGSADIVSASYNHMDWVQSLRLNNLWRSAWQSAALLQWI